MFGKKWEPVCPNCGGALSAKAVGRPNYACPQCKLFVAMPELAPEWYFVVCRVVTFPVAAGLTWLAVRAWVFKVFFGIFVAPMILVFIWEVLYVALWVNCIGLLRRYFPPKIALERVGSLPPRGRLFQWRGRMR